MSARTPALRTLYDRGCFGTERMKSDAVDLVWFCVGRRCVSAEGAQMTAISSVCGLYG